MGTNPITVGSIFDWIVSNWSAILVVSTTIGLVVKVTRKMDKFATTLREVQTTVTKELPEVKKKQDQVEEHLSSIDKDLKKTTEHIEDSKTRSLILCKGVAASLKGLQEVGANGPTNEALAELENYMLKRSVS